MKDSIKEFMEDFIPELIEHMSILALLILIWYSSRMLIFKEFNPSVLENIVVIGITPFLHRLYKNHFRPNN